MRTRPRMRLRIASLSVIGAVLLLGCGDGNGPKPPTLADAWRQFEARNYSGAVATFHAVLATDSSLTDGYNGLGWSFAFDDQLDSATIYFGVALERDSTLADAHAGLSALRKALGDLDGAITQASAALQLDSTWTFAHYTGTDYLDLHLILAMAYFGQGQASFPMAQAQVDFLDPNNGLSPDDEETWEPHPSYEAALLKAIQDLEETIGAEMML